jgi:ribonuclease III
MTDITSLKDSFINKALFDHALTHRSWVNEHRGERTSNERLEFLGDAILEFIVSQEIFNKYPDKEEGYLTALRATLVNTVALAEFARNFNIGEHLYLSKGEEESGGRTNTSLLADTVEALIGSIFIDRGLPAASEFINESLLKDLDKKAASSLKDSKSLLQEYVQSQGYGAPRYRVASEAGPDHDKKFVIEVLIQNTVWGVGEGKSKSSAEQAAAGQAMAKKVSV